MTRLTNLDEALRDEDRRLREILVRLPRALREQGGPAGALSPRETIGHIAFWDDFTVSFFTRRLDPTLRDPEPPVRFEETSRAAIAACADLPFGEVLARYLEATGALLDFVNRHWDRLTDQERRDFWVTVKHRRHHRILLSELLKDANGGPREGEAGA